MVNFAEEMRQEELDEELFSAAGWGKVDAARDAIKRGACVNARSESSDNPIHLAAEVGSKEMCDLLIAAGARLDGFNRKGNSPLHAAAVRGQLECCELLIAAGADVNLQSDSGEAPIHSASLAKDPKIVRLLVEAGAEVGLRCGYGYSPLHYAALHGSVEVARVLTELGLSSSEVPAVPGEFCLTPFQRAVRYGRLEMAEYFVIECGETLDQATQDGRTLEELATQNSGKRVFEDLRAIAAQAAVISGVAGVSDRDAPARRAGFSPL
jgi:ankyrin repeat protein